MKIKPYHQRIREKYLPHRRQPEVLAWQGGEDYIPSEVRKPVGSSPADTYTGLLEQNLISGVWKDE